MLAWLNPPSPAADYFVPSFLICIEDGYRDNPYHSRQVGKGNELALIQQLCSPSEYQQQRVALVGST